MKIVDANVLHLPGERDNITVLTLDGNFPNTKWDSIVVDGERYTSLYMSGARFDLVAIEGEHDFVGKDVEFI